MEETIKRSLLAILDANKTSVFLARKMIFGTLVSMASQRRTRARTDVRSAPRYHVLIEVHK
jgi:hypothetical protein